MAAALGRPVKGADPLTPESSQDDYCDRLMYQADTYREVGHLYVDARKAEAEGKPSVAALWRSYADGRADLIMQISAELLAWRQANPDPEGRW